MFPLSLLAFLLELVLQGELFALASAQPDRVGVYLVAGVVGLGSSVFVLARENWARKTLMVMYGFLAVGLIVFMWNYLFPLGLSGPTKLLDVVFRDLFDYNLSITGAKPEDPQLQVRMTQHLWGFYLPFLLLFFSGALVVYFSGLKVRWYCSGVDASELERILTSEVEDIKGDQTKRETALAALWALRAVPQAKSLELISPALRSDDPGVRIGACMVLGETAYEGAREALQEVAEKDAEEEVRRAAIRALGRNASAA